MQRPTEHKLNLADPLLDRVGFWLLALRVLLEEVRVVAVQIEAARIVSKFRIPYLIDFIVDLCLQNYLSNKHIPSLRPIARALLRYRIAVRIQRRQNVNARIVQQPLDVRIGSVARHEILNEMQHQLLADRLVAMDIGNVLDVRLADHVLVRRRGHHDHPQIAALRRLADRVERGQVWEARTGRSVDINRIKTFRIKGN